MTVLCPICKIESPYYLSAKDFNQGISESTFRYYRCPSCGLVFLFPTPNNLGTYYVPSYPAYQMPTCKDLEARAEQEFYKMEIIQKYITRGRLLEIGPSYGAFAYLAKKAGFEVEVIEMDARCCQYLTEVVGVKAVNSTHIPNALHNLKPYNAIALWHVIEHLEDPWAVLTAISNKLLPGGILLLAAPNPSALQFKLFGRYWTHLDAPRHLQLIPMQLLITQMQSLGMQTVLATTTDKASTIFNTYPWWMVSCNIFLKAVLSFYRKTDEVDFKSNRNERYDTCRDKILSLLRKSLFLPARIIMFSIAQSIHLTYSFIFKHIEKREGLGSAYTLIFTKQ